MTPRIDEEITFRRLEILLAFLEAGSLARAAEQLGISAVSVHRALHALETGTRCALFRHEGRNLLPNDAAHELAEVARDVLRTMAEGIRATRQTAGYAADRIRIGSLYSLTSGTVPAVIRALRLRKPDLQTELVLGSNADLLQKLHEGSVDAALMGAPTEQPDLESQALFEDEMLFAAPATSAHARCAEIDLSACSHERFVSLADGFVTQMRFAAAFGLAGFTPTVVMTTEDIFSLMNLVGGGLGCTLLPGRVRGVLPKEVCLIPLQARFRLPHTITLSFLRTRERDPNVLALLAACRQFAAEAAKDKG